MKKRVTSLFLALLMAFTLLPVQALAEELDAAEPAAVQEEPLLTAPVTEQQEVTITEESSLLDAEAGSGTGAVYTGTLGENVSWSLDTGTGALTVTGSGPMGDYGYEESPLWNYRGYIKSVTIADTVNSVGRDVFRDCTNLVDIDLGCGITEIHVEAFGNCDRLEEIVIPDSVTSIDYGAFYGCYGLTELVISNSVTSIGDSAFCWCSNLTSVTMGSGVTKIGSQAFDYCNKLNKVVISDLTAWLKISFNGYNSNPLYTAHALYLGDELLTDLVIPGMVTEINQHAFDGCTSITSVYIPQSVKSIGQSAFNGMSSLKTVRYAGSQDDWRKINIGSYNDSLTNLTPEFDQSLADYCRITTAATEYGTVAVDNATAKVGDTVTITAIPAAGYAVESYLVDGVAIPDGGNTFTAAGDHVVTATFVKAYDVADGGKAYGDCGANVKWALDTEGTLHVYGTGAMYDYNGNNGGPFYRYRNDIQSVQFSGNITTIGNYVFWYCDGLTEVVIPDSVTTIGNSAFQECGGLTEIVIPASVTTINDWAFGSCVLTSVEFLGNAPANFAEGTFGYNPSNFAIFYHSGTTGWTSPTWNGYNAVCCDSVITDYSTLDDDNRNGQGIYFKLNWLSKTAVVSDGSKQQNSCGYTGGQQGAVVIPDTVTKGGTTYTVKGINQYAFEGCPFVRSVTLGANISTVSPSAFWNCKNLTAFSVSKANTFFKAYDGVLYDLSGLYLYVYPGGKANTSYTPLATCRTIGKTAFFGAHNLTMLNIPSTVTAILEGAFAYCPNLQEITLPFVGGSAQDDQPYSFSSVFDSHISISDWDALDMKLRDYFNNSYSQGNIAPKLKTVTILRANFSDASFADCSKLEEIFFPNCNDLTTIPEYCFNGCSSLTRLLLGQSKSSTQTGILIPASVTKIETAAFAGCGRISQFVVAAGNTAFTADQWGVLYSRDMSVLRYYPAGREWPYYNVNDRTRTIDSFAFMNCGELVNVYIPKTVTTLEFEAISQCPMVTFCVYCDSAADLYMSQHSLTAWYMDNCTLQNIEIIHLPDQVIAGKNRVLASSLYAKGAYSNEGQTIELQLEDYTLSLSQPYGTQEVTLSSGGKTVTFEAPVIRQGNINGNATAQSDIDASDMQCLYELLTTGQCQSQIKNREDLELVADVNNDDHVDVYDLQMLYEAVSGISKL